MWKSVLVLTLILATSCIEKESSSKSQKSLNTFETGDTLVVATTNSPISYYEGPNNDPEGFEHDLVKTFAETIEAKVEFKLYDNVAQLLSATASNNVHVAAAGLTRTDKRQEQFHFGPVYQETTTYLVCDRAFDIKNLEKLQLPLTVTAESSYLDYLQSLSLAHLQLTISEKPSEDILVAISEGKEGCTIGEDNILAMLQDYLPNLHPVMKLPLESKLSWMFASSQEELAKTATAWFKDFSKTQKYRSLVDQYYGHKVEADAYDIKRFVSRIESRLPKLKEYFISAAKENDFDWKFLAAVAYQESHWSNKTKSFTGVRGIMMLTQNTAKALGVTNRLDPEQSIKGGSQYLRQLTNRLPQHIPETERPWMALAAYNLGYSHLRDARMLAVRKDLNPNRWTDVEAVLPLLASKKYYKQLPAGAARGYEAVDYVRKTRNYLKILERQLSQSSH